MKLVRALPLGLLLSFGAPALAGPAQPALAQRLLQSHNIERAAVGAAPLAWDASLAAAAQSYANELAATDRWGHSRDDQRRGQGENLWMGTRGFFAPEKMVADWASEKAMFRPGTFPNVSSTGSWHDIGHYTQMIWPATQKVGCGIRSSGRWDYLVCRYSAPGNVTGQRVGPASVARR